VKKIEGGYYIKARCIQNSEIAHCPPHFREIWDWLIKEANHKDKKVSGKTIKRGQLFTSYQEIRDGLKWKVGYRFERYKKWQCENAMKFLRKAAMVAVTKTARGVIITILNYDTYQNPENYESRNGSRNESRGLPQSTDTKNKNVKKEKKKEETKEYPVWLDLNLWKEFKKMRVKIKKPLTEHAENLAIQELEKLTQNNNERKKIINQSIYHSWQGFYPLKKIETDSGKEDPFKGCDN